MDSPDYEEQPNQASLNSTLERLRTESLDTSSDVSVQNVQTNLSDLADASRTNTALRTRLAAPETLDALLRIVSNSLVNRTPARALLATAALRCIGNACIDNEVARSAVIESKSSDSAWAHKCLTHRDAAVVTTGLKVLYNLCADHEPAQKWGYEQDLHVEVIALLSDGKPKEAPCVVLGEGERGLGFELLFWITNQRPTTATGSGSSKAIEEKDSMAVTERDLSRMTLHKLLRLPYLYAPELDGEDFAMLGEICLTYLRDPVVQRLVREYKLVQYVWRMLLDNERKIQQSPKEIGENESASGEIKVLLPLSSSLTWCLSDIAAIRSETAELTDASIDFEEPFFCGLVELVVFLGAPQERQATSAQSWQAGISLTRQGTMVRIEPSPIRINSLPIEGDHITTKITSDERDISTQVNEQDRVPESQSILVAACQFLANVLWSKDPQPDNAMWTREDLYASLWSAISASENVELLHAAAGLLVQLSRISLNFREVVARDMNAVLALERLCRHATPPVKQDGAKLLRALAKESAANQAKFADLAKEVLQSMAEDAQTTAAANAT
nr:hypothetical protein CFP56_62865 [Quercus suber]